MKVPEADRRANGEGADARGSGKFGKGSRKVQGRRTTLWPSAGKGHGAHADAPARPSGAGGIRDYNGSLRRLLGVRGTTWGLMTQVIDHLENLCRTYFRIRKIIL
jgi:hypothetical protein